MSAIEETFNPAALARSDTISSTLINSKGPQSATKPKATQSYPRIDFEPLYTELKSLIGNNWGIYFDALTRFIRGELCSNEFGDLTDTFLLASPTIEHAHNVLICAIIHNTGRDNPDPGPAVWVTAATDKTGGASSTKPAVTSDAGEQRLKKEIMKLPARDRRRLKAANGEKTEEENTTNRTSYEEYYMASRIKAPDTVPASAGGLTKTNWELEIRKRYAQPLYAESLEFPDAATIFARIVPICYEESVAAGSTMQCAELVGIAAEMFVKGFLSDIFNRTRSNGPTYDSGTGGGIFTSKFQKHTTREENDVKSGKIQRVREDDLLPYQFREVQNRRPIGMCDLQLASHVGPNPWNGMPLLGTVVSEAAFDGEKDEWQAERDAIEQDLKAEAALHPITNGHNLIDGDEAMDVDEDDDYGWEGTGYMDREALGSLLDDCLAIRA